MIHDVFHPQSPNSDRLSVSVSDILFTQVTATIFKGMIFSISQLVFSLATLHVRSICASQLHCVHTVFSPIIESFPTVVAGML